METIGKLGHVLGETWYGAVICVVATLVVVYFNIRKIGGLELTFEERQEKVKALGNVTDVVFGGTGMKTDYRPAGATTNKKCYLILLNNIATKKDE